MPVDPLSSATRATKKSLLAASLAAVTFKAFDVSIDSIPVAGVLIQFDRGVFSFLLVAVLVYFLLLFGLYYFIDVRNIETTQHQIDSEKAFFSRVQHFARAYDERIRLAIKRELPNELRVVLNALVVPGGGFRGKKPAADEIIIKIIQSSGDNSRQNSQLNREEHAEYYYIADSIAKKHVEQFWWRFTLFRITNWRRLTTVRTVYFVRNYFTDGVFPVIIGLLALAAMFNIVNFRWLQAIVPLH